MNIRLDSQEQRERKKVCGRGRERVAVLSKLGSVMRLLKANVYIVCHMTLSVANLHSSEWPPCWAV